MYTFKYKLGEFVFAHDLQGEGHTSPFKDQEVSNVKGIITAVSYKDSYQKGLYIQTPDAKIDEKIGTSEGIFVKPADTNGFNVGDMVIVSGTVKEVKNGIYDPDNLETIIDGATVTVVSSGNELPNSIVLGNGGRALITDHIDNDSNTTYDPEEDALDYYESLEGMLVKINDPVVVGMDERYGEFAVLADNGDASAGKRTPYGGIKATLENHNPEVIHIDDVIIPISGPSKTYYDSSFAPKVGDKFDGSIEGVMSFGFGKYKVLNTSPLPNLIDNGLEITNTNIVVDEDKLTIASFNIENFHKGVESGKIEKIAKTIAVQLKTPDIVGVIEMQDNNGATNDGTTAADENATVLIDAINNALATPVNYKYVEIEPVDGNEGGQPGGNIRVAYIYNADRVSLYDAPVGSNTEDVVFKNGHLLNNPGRVATTSAYFESTRRALAAEFVFKGDSVVVIANHLSSKRGDEGEFGPNQPPVKGSEKNRHGQAQELNDFIDTIMLDDPNANVVVLGDLNDYEYSETVSLLKGKGTENILTNMIDKLPLNERMTYIHNGNSQVLDHVLVSNNLTAVTEVDVVNANSMVTAASGRSSDHDPVIIQVDLAEEIIVDPMPEYKDTDLLLRQYMMVLVARLFDVEDQASTYGIPADYSDVLVSDWFASYVWFADYQGWTAGMGDGSFGVDLPVDAKQVAVFKLKASGYVVPDYNNVLTQLSDLGIEWNVGNTSEVTVGEAEALMNTVIPEPVIENIKDVRSINGSDAIVIGVVTAKIPNKSKVDYYIEDSTGGILLSEFKLEEDSLNLSVGDVVEVTGKINLFYDMSQIQVTSVDQVVKVDTETVTPQVIVATAIDESVEGELVKVENLKVISIDSNSNVTMKSDDKEVVVYGKPVGVTVNVGDEFDSITGVVSYHFNKHKIFVRGTDDLVKKAEPVENPVDIKNLRTLALDGSVKDAFNSNDMVYVDVTVENISEESAQGDLLINVKSEDAGVKTMKKFSMFPVVQLGKDLSQTFRVGFETFEFLSGNYDVEVYFWDSLNGQKPLAESEEITFTIE